MIYPHYGWIIFGWYPENWWTKEVAGEFIDTCTDKEIEDFIERARPLLIHLIPEPDDYNLTTTAGIVCVLYLCVNVHAPNIDHLMSLSVNKCTQACPQTRLPNGIHVWRLYLFSGDPEAYYSILVLSLCIVIQ